MDNSEELISTIKYL